MAACNLACEGLSGASTTPDLAQRKLYIGGLTPDISSEILLNFFGRHGEIEEGSVAYDKDTNESRYGTIQFFVKYLILRILPVLNSAKTVEIELTAFLSDKQWVWFCYIQDSGSSKEGLG